jgi:eukaryotic-like serine/threonine-protein kinase
VATPPPSKQVAPAPPVSGPTQTASVAYSPETLDRITRKLAAYIGPIAKIVVQRAASRHSNLQDLYKTLSEEIESAKDRKEFLASQHTRHD